MPQTQVRYTHRRGYAGDIASGNYTCIGSALQEYRSGLTGNAVIPFGVMGVYSATDPSQIVLPTAKGMRIAGIIVRDMKLGSTEDGFLSEIQGVPAGRMLDCLEEGDIWVQVEKAIVAGSKAYFRVIAQASPLDKLGFFTDTLDAVNNDPVPSGRFKTGTTAAGIAILSVGRALLA